MPQTLIIQSKYLILRARMIAQFPLKTNWEAIHRVVQGENETLYDYLARLPETFNAHGGVDKPTDLREQTIYETQLTRECEEIYRLQQKPPVWDGTIRG